MDEEYEPTGELRKPKKGEYFLAQDSVLRAIMNFQEKEFPIVKAKKGIS